MDCPVEVLDLVERFERELESYRSGRYNETQVRREFIDPMLKAVGWDIDNEQGYAEAYKDVVHEDAIRIGSTIKAPDYCFRVGGTRKFFLEAKKPSINVKDDVAPAFQLRRYAWSAKLPLSILTDFEEFAVYDCRIKPQKQDKASTARILYMNFREYPQRWEEIASVFSREAILKGSFDRFADSSKRKKGTAEVDAAFLAEIETWREALARNLALRNPAISQRELNFAVQQTIDRLIFLRICEDRAIEDYGQLRDAAKGAGVYARLRELFVRADQRYNSGLFHFQNERGRSEAPDALTPTLDIDDRPLREIIASLYYPDSPYEFSVLPADILGQVYEQFLGKVIRLTEGHRAVVEDKPEVKKAGGVYYTPTYIVDCIVKQTLGELLSGKTPAQAAEIRVVDPACGSGSFLIGAYQYLLDWHRDWYVADGMGKHRRQLYEHGVGDCRLTTVERKRILLNNIYGVDIDPQAVEVTKLSLLLKVLEGESADTLQSQLQLLQDRALPDLEANIKCGNSLVGPDFYQQGDLRLFSEDERFRLNTFQWESQFPGVFAREAAGFDAVIGNPPYGAALALEEQVYLRNTFAATTKDLDTYVLFMEQGLRISRTGGLMAMIVPTGWYSGAKFHNLRRHVARVSDPKVFINLPYDIFHAWVDTTVFVLQKRSQPSTWPRQERCPVKLLTFPKRHRILSVNEFDDGYPNADLCEWFQDGADEYLTYADSATTALVNKLKTVGRPLSDYADVQRGVTPFKLTQESDAAMSRRAFAGTIRRYRVEPGPTAYIRFDDSLAEPKPERYFQGPRLLLREMISRQFRLQAAMVSDDFVTNKSMQTILAASDKAPLRFLLAVVNSRLISWYFLQTSSVAHRDDFPKIVLKETRGLPVPTIDPTERHQVEAGERLAAMVELLTALQDQLANAPTASDKVAIQRQMAATDAGIDRVVYGLFGLSDGEIAVIESGVDI